VRKLTIELKIAILIVITAGLVGIAGYISYKSISYIVSTIKKEAQPNMSLVLIKEINSSLIQAESSIKYYVLTGQQKYLVPYYEVTKSTNSKIEQLRDFNLERSDRILQIDSINVLLKRKFVIWNRMLALKGGDRLENALSQLSVKLDTSFDTMSIKVPQNIIIFKRDTISKIVEEQDIERESFFTRLFKKKEDAYETDELDDVSTVYIQEEVISKDTLIEIGIDPVLIQDEISRIKKEEGEVQQLITAREISLSRQSDAIALKLSLMIHRLEQQELASIKEKAIEADKLAKSTNKLLAFFIIIFLILLISVFYVIQKYVKKSHASQVALVKAKDEALRLTETRERFMANISHEIRTPMHAIAGFAEQLLHQVKDKDTHEHIEIIKKSADHLHGIINDVLDFSKLDSGKFEIEKIAFSPKEIIKEVFQLYQAKAENIPIEYKLNFESNMPDVLIGDPLRLKQIMHNLISNALKFTKNGFVKVLVLSKKINSDYSNLLIRVSDSGIGISEKNKKFIFEEFSQAEASTSRKFGGTGLGLTIVKKLVEIQGGKIEVKSKLKEGTSFFVEIPYYIGNELYSTDKIVKKNIQPDLLSDLHFLIADDDEYNRGLITHIFKKWKMRFTIVDNGKKIIDEIESGKKFDLILLDIQMPEMNGIEVADCIRNSEDNAISRTTIMALTATTAREELARCYQVGINHIMSKPYSEYSLFSNICEVLKIEIPEESIIDHEVVDHEDIPVMFKNLYHIANNDEEFVVEMLHMFIKTSRDGILEVKKGFEDSDWIKVAEYAHKIKSPCKHLDALETANMLKEIEIIARNDKDKEKLRDMISHVEKEINYLIYHVEKYLSLTSA
jgi:signal transduction histidine kinase/HPt (histidine-containing phosphotransfer) domain-containing protein